MISISCTSCQAPLTIDDAFAGGVCRCQFCGAIQTVPSRNARTRAAAPGAGATKEGGKATSSTRSSAGGGSSGNLQKTLYTKKSHGTAVASGTGLDHLADAVASSGLSGSGLTGSGLSAGHNRRKLTGAPGAGRPAVSHMPKLIAAGATIVVLLVVVVWLAMRGPQTVPAGPDSQTSTGGDGARPVVPIPTFLGTRIDEPIVIYLLDRGDASRGTLDYARLGLLKSLATLRRDQKFQVIFWKTSEALTVYPIGGPAEVSTEAIEGCRKAMDAVVAYGTSDVKPAMENAMKANPSAIVIASGKLLGDDFSRAVLDIRKSGAVKIYCLSLAETGSGDAMRQVALTSGGTYRDVDRAELMALTR